MFTFIKNLFKKTKESVSRYFLRREANKTYKELAGIFDVHGAEHKSLDALHKMANGKVSFKDNTAEAVEARKVFFGKRGDTWEGTVDTIVDWNDEAEKEAERKEIIEMKREQSIGCSLFLFSSTNPFYLLYAH